MRKYKKGSGLVDPLFASFKSLQQVVSTILVHCLILKTTLRNSLLPVGLLVTDRWRKQGMTVQKGILRDSNRGLTDSNAYLAQNPTDYCLHPHKP